MLEIGFQLFDLLSMLFLIKLIDSTLSLAIVGDSLDSIFLDIFVDLSNSSAFHMMVELFHIVVESMTNEQVVKALNEFDLSIKVVIVHLFRVSDAVAKVDFLLGEKLAVVESLHKISKLHDVPFCNVVEVSSLNQFILEIGSNSEDLLVFIFINLLDNEVM